MDSVTPPLAPSSRFILRGAAILGADGRYRSGHLIVEGPRIVAVGLGGPQSSAVSETLDLGGRAVVPSLIDCHVHLFTFPPASATDPARRSVERAISAVRLCTVLASQGMAGVRDLGYPDHGIFAIREAIEAGQLIGPQLALAGRAVAASAGHGSGAISVEVDGPDSVRRVVRREIAAGADWIKLMVTGGTATATERVSDVQMSAAELSAAVEEAHDRGVRVAAHCSNARGAWRAVEAGVDSIEHGIEIDRPLADAMAQRGIWLVPALRCTSVEAEGRMYVPEHVRSRAAAIHQRQRLSFQVARAAGVRIAAGSDAGPAYWQVGRASLIGELEAMVELGMSHFEAMRAASEEAARLLGWERELGWVEVGRRADFTIVEATPEDGGTFELDHLARPWLVFRLGRPVEVSP